MNSAVLAILFALLAGAAVQLQAPMASLMGQKLGMFSSVFIVHIGGALLSLIPLTLAGGENIREWRTLPWYILLAGAFGLIVVSAMTYTIPRIGASATVTLMVVAQLVLASIVDHFGLLGTSTRPITFPQLIGFGVLVLGAWLVTK